MAMVELILKYLYLDGFDDYKITYITFSNIIIYIYIYIYIIANITNGISGSGLILNYILNYMIPYFYIELYKL